MLTLNIFSEIARNYKEEGINHFKYKKYRFAIASFSAGLKEKFEDDELRSQLYNNIAAAHMQIGYYYYKFVKITEYLDSIWMLLMFTSGSPEINNSWSTKLSHSLYKVGYTLFLFLILFSLFKSFL